jgi:tRNA threonylcarbamoyladenosine biosynthesis protein TsaB
MKLLALDAATEACSAALYHDGEARERFEIAPRRHAELLLPMAKELLAEAGWRLQDLDALAFGRGPGAFTGVRIAAGLIQGLAYGANLPVAPVSDLAAQALRCAREQGARKVLCLQDARMGEVYWAAFDCYEPAAPAALAPERVSEPTALPVEDFDTGWHGAGNGWAAHETALAPLAARLGRIGEVTHPHAADIVRLAANMLERGEIVDAAHAMPTYVRDEVARKTST